MILGVSFDTPDDNKKFAEKFHFNFPLICDTDRTGYLRGTVKDARGIVEQFRALGCTRLSIAFREGPYDWDALEAFATEIVRAGS